MGRIVVNNKISTKIQIIMATIFKSMFGTRNDNPNEKEAQSQCKQILKWLEAGNGITAIDALRKFGCLRLSSRIFDLREKGVKIITDYTYTKSGKRIALYHL